MTLEEAQAEIIRLNEALTERTNECDTLSQNNTALIRDKWKMRDTEFIKMLAEGQLDDQ